MPCALRKRHELHEAAIAPDQQVRRHLEAPDLPKVRVGIPVELVRKQCLDLRPPKLTRRQTDAVNDNHRWRYPVGARIAIGAGTVLCLLEETSGFVHPEEA